MSTYVEPWRDKLSPELVDRIDRHRAKKGPVTVLVMTVTANNNQITIPVPPDVRYKKVKITITMEE